VFQFEAFRVYLERALRAVHNVDLERTQPEIQLLVDGQMPVFEPFGAITH
jgi:hypothetical protein